MGLNNGVYFSNRSRRMRHRNSMHSSEGRRSWIHNDSSSDSVEEAEGDDANAN